MNQMTFSDMEYSGRKRVTQKERFLREMNDIIPWTDCVLKEAYSGATLMNDHMTGDFPVLVPGINGISWTGNVSRVVIAPEPFQNFL